METPRRATLWIAAMILLASCRYTAHARPVAFWQIENIAQEAHLLVVGEVLETAKGESIPADKSGWKVPVLNITATVKPLRCFPSDADLEVKDGAILIGYGAVDWDNYPAVIDGPVFLELTPGDILVFPLRPANGDGTPYDLIGLEDFNLLVPAAAGRLEGVKPATALEFLRAELAGALAVGRHEDAFRAGEYLGSMYGPDSKDVRAVYALLDAHVKDEARWLDIAVAVYSAMPQQRPKLDQLSNDRPGTQYSSALVEAALSHVKPEGLADRFIALSLEHAHEHRWGTAATLALNYSDHPATTKLLGKALEQDSEDALYIAQYIIKKADTPLVPAAAAAAKRAITRHDAPGFKDPAYEAFRAACDLIRDYGSDADFAFLLDELRKAQKTNRPRYERLWQCTIYGNGAERLRELCRIAITDTNVLSDTWRFCDHATSTLQRVTSVDFGFDPGAEPDDRDKAIEKARAWLAEQSTQGEDAS